MQRVKRCFQGARGRISWERAAALTLVLLLSGCASANKRYEQGIELEQQGQYIEAARKYIDALKKDRNHAEARDRLRLVGPRAIDEYLQSAGQALAAGREPDAADNYVALDAFLASAASVGERLPLPADYAAQRREVFDQAIASLIADGYASEERGEWYAAKRAYDRADRYYPDADQVDTLLGALVRTHLGWCRYDIDMGRYRSAVQHADEAFALSGGGGDVGEEALALRATAIELGTIPVAIAPLWRTDDAARFLPEGFVTALNDELELLAWHDPPIFIAVMEPLEVRRAMRELRYHSTLLTLPEAARLGRLLGAHTVVAGDIAVFTITERDVREEVRNTKTLWDNQPATYIRREGKLDYRLRLSYALVDPVSQRTVRESTVEVRESGEFERAVYNGDWTKLDLTRNERRWFEADRQREFELAIEERLLTEAALEFSERVYRDLVNRID